MRRTAAVSISVAAFLAAGVSARAAAQDVVIGSTERIESRILDETRKLLVYVPPDYRTARTRYPVLYLLDGDVHFHHVSGLVDFLAWSKRGLPMIVVGICTVDRTRDLTARRRADAPTSGGADRFLAFIERELFPFVEGKYRTSGTRILVGHSLGGSFAFYTLFNKPRLFNAYIAIAPGDPVGDADAAWVERALPGLAGLERKLLFSIGERDNRGAARFLARLSELLKQKAPADLTWVEEAVAGGDHWSIVHNAIYRGLTMFYPGWGLPPDETLREGADAVKTYFRKVSPDAPPEGAVVDVARRLLVLEQTNAAVTVLKWAAELYPRSAGPLDALGQIYEQAGDLKSALAAYEVAYRIAVETKSPGADALKARYDRVKKLLDGKRAQD
jgi:predicted alpha/beta superfamily hydrolase